MPPVTKPARMMALGMGATSISSMWRWNLEPKNDDTTLE
jgi:di/tricarboxylate transporter